LEFQLHPDGTTTHASLANEKIKPNTLLPAIQLRLEHKDEPNEAPTENGQRKGSLKNNNLFLLFTFLSFLVLRIFLTNYDEKLYQMTGWQACAEKLASLEEGKLYKFEGLKSLELSYGDSDIELVFLLCVIIFFAFILFQISLGIWPTRQGYAHRRENGLEKTKNKIRNQNIRHTLLTNKYLIIPLYFLLAF
jgi:hypothetical protein